jgi:hypothetical protein
VQLLDAGAALVPPLVEVWLVVAGMLGHPGSVPATSSSTLVAWK